MRLAAVGLVVGLAIAVHGDLTSSSCSIKELNDIEFEGPCYYEGQVFDHTLTDLVPRGAACELRCNVSDASVNVTCNGKLWLPSLQICKDIDTAFAVQKIMMRANESCSRFDMVKPPPPSQHGAAKIHVPKTLKLQATLTYRNFPCADIYMEILGQKIYKVIHQSECVSNDVCSGGFELTGCAVFPNSSFSVSTSDYILQIAENITFTNDYLYGDDGNFKENVEEVFEKWQNSLEGLSSFGVYIEKIVKDGLLDLNINNTIYNPDPTTVSIKGEVVCPSGMESRNCICVYCDRGSYGREGRCLPCEMGFYQDQPGQSECRKCPMGNTTVTGAAARSTCRKHAVVMTNYKDPIILTFIVVLVGLAFLVSMIAVLIRKHRGKNSYSTEDVVISTEAKYYPPETEA